MLLPSVHAIGCVLFTYAAVVQYNDPDPLRWIGVYGGAALMCALAAVGRGPTRFATVIGVLLCAAAGAGWVWAPPGATSLSEEIVRETLGLGIAGVWMLGIGLTPAPSAETHS